MNETQWLAADDILDLIKVMRRKGSNRQKMLLACALCRGVAPLLQDLRCHQALEMTERCSDRRVKKPCVEAASAVAWAAWKDQEEKTADGAVATAVLAVRCAVNPSGFYHAIFEALDAVEHDEDFRRTALEATRCIFGNPFQPVTFPAAVLTAQAMILAEAAYEERDMPSGRLDHFRIAVLADSLEEAGATEESLSHLRGPGLHWKGCRVVDAVMGRT